MSTKSSKSTTKTSDSRIADNKKALFNYAIEERFEAGMVLQGWEVKALREGKVDAVDGTVLDVSFQTVCIHSDPPNARDVAAAMRRVLDAVQR